MVELNTPTVACKAIERKKAFLSIDVGTVNLAYCMLDHEGIILFWNVVDISAASYDKQCEKLIRELDKIDYEKLEGMYDIVVVIERQPCKNPKMRVISGQIQMYYAIEKYSQSKDQKSLISKIIYYSPKFKLKYYEKQAGDKEIIVKTYKSPYTFRKNLAKQHCDILIHRKINHTDITSKFIQSQHFIEQYEKSKKCDDMADSMLQGLAYIKGL